MEGIIFWSFSRLARRPIDAQFIKSDLRRQGYVLHSMTDDVPTGDIAPVVEAIIDWKNEHYLSDLSRDVKRGLYDRRGRATPRAVAPTRLQGREGADWGEEGRGTPPGQPTGARP